MTAAVIISVLHVTGDAAEQRDDRVAVEDPLEIRIGFGPGHSRSRRQVSVTMRTPGHDADLAVGFLFAEGVIAHPADVMNVVESGDNIVRVDLAPGVPVDESRLARFGVTASACGVCGKTSLDAVERAVDGPRPGGSVTAGVLHAMPDAARAAQPGFAATGGVHAAALFDFAGKLLAVREDVGRHNAADKLFGAEFRAGRLPLHDRVLLVSGRASFELVQKAAAAGVPVFAAVGAPSSLAVELARRTGMTLAGFVRGGRMNVYAGAERVLLPLPS